MKDERRFWRIVGGAALVGVAVLWLFPILPFSLPVICPLRALWGLPCPGCGMTRATALLLGGDLAGSLACHALAIPILILLALFLVRQMGLLSRPRAQRPMAKAAAGCLAVLLGFHALRLGTMAVDGSLGDAFQTGAVYRAAHWALNLF